MLDVDRLEAWGRTLADRLSGGARLLVAGNGGSAAEAQHLTAELVGRFRTDRRALSAIALHADSSAVTAIGNDFGFTEVFTRQVRAHGRPGDILLTLSTSGTSENLLRAARAARDAGLLSWAMTGPTPNQLASQSDDVVSVDAASGATVQECHLAAIHILCAAIDDTLAGRRPEARTVEAERTPRRLVIVGDTLLDRDVDGDAERLSPEAVAPIVLGRRTTLRPGGAGLAAVMAASEPGWAVTLVSALGPDEAGEQVRQLLATAGVELVDIGTGGRTSVKTRIRARGRTLVRVDEGGPVELGDLPRAGQDALADAGTVLVCDYGCGLTARADVREAVATAAARVPVVWDPHPRGAPPVDRVTVVVPNAAEARTAVGGVEVGGVEGDGLAVDVARARSLLRRWPVRQVALTRGAAGAVLVQDQVSTPLVVPATRAAGLDECGAGDRFAVTVAMMLGRGRLPSEAVSAAVATASDYVATGGPTGLVLGAVPQPSEDDAWAVVTGIRARGGHVVVAGGCFDLLHVGHVSLLEQARRLGDCLVVCLNSDGSVARLKGPNRPLVPQQERAAMLRALASVDAVVVFDADTPEEILTRLKPDVYVKGGDYTIGQISEATAVESWGGQVVLVPYRSGRSTTSLIDLAAQSKAAP